MEVSKLLTDLFFAAVVLAVGVIGWMIGGARKRPSIKETNEDV